MKILDCTLRDGGYYTNWDFDKSTVQTYLRSVDQLPIDILEVGYRSNPKKSYLGEFFYSPIKTLEYLRASCSKQLAIILDEKDVKPQEVGPLLNACNGLVDMVRVAVNPKNFRRALKLAEAIKAQGFVVSFNVMYMSSWKEEAEFIDSIKDIGDSVDYFYMVDSYGGVYPEDVRENYKLIRDQCDTKIGFHGHDNLELALINTLTAMECGVDIIDATITGMGRGAGNLKMELLLTVLNSRYGYSVNYNALSEVVTSFEDLQRHYGWGTNLAYMVSGVTSSPQSDVMEWVTKYLYSFNSVIQAMENRKNGEVDNQKLPVFTPTEKYEEAVVVGGGPSVVQHVDAVRNFLERNPEVCLIHASSKNAQYFSDLPNDQYFCLVGNEGQRLERVFQDLKSFEGICVLPPYPRQMGTYVPPSIQNKSYELDAIDFLDSSIQSLTAVALQCAKDIGVKTALLVGYDGYGDGNISQRERDLFLENEAIFQAASTSGLDCASMLPTKYESLMPNSVYARV